MTLHRVLNHWRDTLVGCSLGLLVLVGCAKSSPPAELPAADEGVSSLVVVDTEDTVAAVHSPVDSPADASEGDESALQPPAPQEPPAADVPPPDELVMEEPEPPPAPAPKAVPRSTYTAGRGSATSARHHRPSARPQGKSKPARMKGGSLSCDFPPIAKQHGISMAKVRLRVHVSPHGQVTRSTAQNDPGYDFVTAAHACAQKMRFSPALDAQGRPTASDITVLVHFRN